MTTPTPKSPAPSAYKPHLIAVLGELTDFNVDASIPMGDTYAPICERMGVTEDAYGMTPDGKYVITQRQIGLAMRALRDKGVTAYAKKGHWCLTAAGVAEARKAAGLPVEVAPPPAPEPVQVVAKTAIATVEQSVPVTPEPETDAEIFHLPVAKPTHPYSDDPYIRSLAISMTGCFGAHSARSSTCKTCPLQADCIGAIEAEKASIAADLEAAEFAAELAETEAKEDAEKKEAGIDELINSIDVDEDADGKFVITADMAAGEGENAADALCAHCMQQIPQGEVAVWVHGHGVFHQGCVVKQG